MRPANQIHLRERDYFLDLDKPSWPLGCLERAEGDSEDSAVRTRKGQADRPSWHATDWRPETGDGGSWGYLVRELHKEPATSRPRKGLWEAVVRFPSAPLSGIQQKPDFQFRLDQKHQHTFRLLTTECPRQHRLTRVLLLLNGVNEIDSFEFYYDLAELLIAGDPQTACIVYPYPGHLTRYPMVGRYAEKPLQRFIMDPSDLFRQYLRFMIEIQWLLSVLVPVSYYPVAPGLSLLAEADNDKQTAGGRSHPKRLSEAILDEWQGIYEYTRRIIDDSDEAEELKVKRKKGLPVKIAQVRHSVETIRRLIDWQPAAVPLAEIELPGSMPPPAIHIIGYSLGAYLAQSAFFTWPFAISSCTSLCAGAALYDLRPVKIAHEEEWRAITHGLKYEIDSGFLEGRIRLAEAHDPAKRSVCGIRASYFSSHFRIFTDVFLQDPHGSYRPRVSEFVPRLLFVVGGNDPIVSTKSVLDASPPEGINLIEIANLTHFIAGEGGEWSSFWLPTVANVITSLAKHSEALLAESVLSNLWDRETAGPLKGEWPPGIPERVKTHSGAARREPQPLDSLRLRRMLAELVQLLDAAEPGFLFILRNQLPFTLMGPHLLHKRGSNPHYEDFEIRLFWQELQDRMQTMRRRSNRIIVAVPHRLREWFGRRPSVLSGKTVPLARELPGLEGLDKIWSDFLDKWETTGSLWKFDPAEPSVLPERKPGNDRFDLEHVVRADTATPKRHPVVNCLPDVWMGLSAEAVTGMGAAADREGVLSSFLRWSHDLYLQLWGHDEHRKRESKELYEWLEKGDLKILRVSAAQANPRYLGERIWAPRSARDLVIHSALALARSTPCAEGDFSRAWR